MGYSERSDAELVERSKAGVAPAFAVLLHRHGPAVRSAVRDDPDPIGAVVETYVRAMRELPDRDPAAPVRPWLLGLAGTEVVHDPIVPLSEEERDEIWAELAVRWPTGRPPHRHETLQRVALVLGLIAVSALVPTLVLLAGHEEREALDELRAFPLQATIEDPGAVDDEAPEPLPSFTFPTVPELEESTAADPAPAATTEPDPGPSPTATATPEPVATETEPATDTGDGTEAPDDGEGDAPSDEEPTPEPTGPEPSDPGDLLPDPPGEDTDASATEP